MLSSLLGAGLSLFTGASQGVTQVASAANQIRSDSMDREQQENALDATKKSMEINKFNAQLANVKSYRY